MDERHYSADREWFEMIGAETVPDDEPVAVCPECGGLLRRDLDEQQGWRCDIHKAVVPEWVHDNDETESRPDYERYPSNRRRDFVSPDERKGDA